MKNQSIRGSCSFRDSKNSLGLQIRDRAISARVVKTWIFILFLDDSKSWRTHSTDSSEFIFSRENRAIKKDHFDWLIHLHDKQRRFFFVIQYNSHPHICFYFPIYHSSRNIIITKKSSNRRLYFLLLRWVLYESIQNIIVSQWWCTIISIFDIMPLSTHHIYMMRWCNLILLHTSHNSLYCTVHHVVHAFMC